MLLPSGKRGKTLGNWLQKHELDMRMLPAALTPAQMSQGGAKRRCEREGGGGGKGVARARQGCI